jgi:hypothetical protein
VMLPERPSLSLNMPRRWSSFSSAAILAWVDSWSAPLLPRLASPSTVSLYIEAALAKRLTKLCGKVRGQDITLGAGAGSLIQTELRSKP